VNLRNGIGTGVLKKIVNWKNDEWDGWFLASEDHRSKGLRHGRYVEFDENRNIKKEQYYFYGIPQRKRRIKIDNIVITEVF